MYSKWEFKRKKISNIGEMTPRQESYNELWAHARRDVSKCFAEQTAHLPWVHCPDEVEHQARHIKLLDAMYDRIGTWGSFEDHQVFF